jgi:peptide/nickel transport system permease protein
MTVSINQPRLGPSTDTGAPTAADDRSRFHQVADAIVANRLAVFGLVVLGLLALLAVFGPALAPYAENDIDVANRLAAPSADHWFGTDELGRDVMSRIMIAARVSLQVGFIAVGIALALGVSIGLVSGYFGGWIDSVLMRVMDALFSFPVILLAIAILAALGPGLTNAMIAIGIVYTPIFARITRGSVLSIKESVFVTAARSIGAGDTRIIVSHILPNVVAPIIVQTSLSLAFAILSEAALSFLGLGVQPPAPAWGRMLADGRGFITDAWWMGFFPGLAIVLTVMSFNFVGDALRDALDPRQRSAIESRGHG